MSEESAHPEVYPRAPIVEAVFEVRFPGEPKIDCHRDQFFEVVRSEYPNVFVPALQPASFPALSPYHFRRPDGAAEILVALNRLAFVSRRYTGYAEFRATALDVFSKFQGLFNLGPLNRTGLRFVNLIPYARENGLIPVDRFLNLSLQLPAGLEYKPVNISLVFATELDGGQLTTKLEAVQDETKIQEALVLDFDYAKVRDLTFDQVFDYLDESHTETKRFFESLITPGFRQWMRGAGGE